MVSQRISRLVDSENDLPRYAEGGYPIYYIDKENSCLCWECANRSYHDTDELPQFAIVDYGVNYEDDSMYCDECSTQIHSAYGDDSDDN